MTCRIILVLGWLLDTDRLGSARCGESYRTKKTGMIFISPSPRLAIVKVRSESRRRSVKKVWVVSIKTGKYRQKVMWASFREAWAELMTLPEDNIALYI